MDAKPLVGILMGSESDKEVMSAAVEQLNAMGIEHDVRVISAHRSPRLAAHYADTAASRGIKVIIAAAGKAAHLAGVVAGHTHLPVIGVPIKTSDLGGMDSLLSTVQMPSGVPVATVAINGSKNAAILAAQIIATSDPVINDTVVSFKKDMEKKIEELSSSGLDYPGAAE